MPRSWLLLRGIPSSGAGPEKYKMSLEHQVVSAGRRLRRTKEGGTCQREPGASLESSQWPASKQSSNSTQHGTRLQPKIHTQVPAHRNRRLNKHTGEKGQILLTEQCQTDSLPKNRDQKKEIQAGRGGNWHQPLNQMTKTSITSDQPR